MNINETIKQLLINSEEIRKAYPTVKNVRHEIMDIPYSDIEQFAQTERKTVHTDEKLKRVYVIVSPFENGKMDSDIWLYSKRLKIIPSQIIEDNGQENAY